VSFEILPGSRSTDSSPARLRTLLVWLGLVAFFQAYSSTVTAVAVPGLRESLNIGDGADVVDISILVITLGAIFAVFVGAAGDRLGRRRILLTSTAIFAILTGLSAAARNPGQFQTAQFLARIFLTAAYAAAIAIAAEEFPTSRRGRAIGSLTALSALGAAFALTYSAAGEGGVGWRALFVIGLAPLFFVILANRSLHETQRHERAHKGREGFSTGAIKGLLSARYRPQVLQVGGLFFCSHVALYGTLVWWVYFARRERELSEGSIGGYLLAAYVAGALGSYVAGRVQDSSGRKKVGSVFLVAATIGAVAGYGVSGSVPLFLTLAVTAFFGLGSTSVANAYAAELFPTEMRMTAVALSRGFFGTIGGVFGPLFVGYLTGGEGQTVGTRAWVVGLFFLGAAGIVRLLPETAGRELESMEATSQISERVEAPYRFTEPMARVSVITEPSASTIVPDPISPSEPSLPATRPPDEEPGPEGSEREDLFRPD
jgi:putative MFS transporter